MSVYYFELTKIAEKDSKFGMSTNAFWQNTSGNSYNTLVNYVIYGDDNSTSASKGHYAFGQLFIQPNNVQNKQPYPPNLIINDQKIYIILFFYFLSRPKLAVQPNELFLFYY
jgi:hypothetical protein